jgi:hypothetical protein
MSSIARVIVSIVLVFAFIPSVVAAQKAGDITVGVMAGVNYSTVSQDPQSSEVSFSYKAGFVGGAFLGYQVTEAFSIEPQVLYSQKAPTSKAQESIPRSRGASGSATSKCPCSANSGFPWKAAR